METAKQEHYSSMVKERSNDSNLFYEHAGKLLHKDNDVHLPDSASQEYIATEFSEFFVQKIRKFQA